MTSLRSFLLLFFVISSAPAQEVDDFVKYWEGSAPIVIVSGHGGGREDEAWEVRSNKGIVTARDGYTQPVTIGIGERLVTEHNIEPYVVVNRIHRKYADVNRAPGPRAFESELGREAFDRFHEKVQEAIDDASKKWKLVFVFDIHGQSKFPADIYLGNLRRKTMNDVQARFREDAFTGRRSLQELLRQRGYEVPEDVAWPGPYKVPGGVSGGWIVDNYGKPLGVDAVQIEIHKRIRYDKQAREKLIDDLAAAIARFHSGIVFRANN